MRFLGPLSPMEDLVSLGQLSSPETLAGKSTLANFLSEASEQIGQSEYWPTQAVRIVEFEVPALKVNGKLVDGQVELWDVSGNNKFESCWPGIQRDASAVIFVYNQDKKEHERELEMWHKHFVQQQGLKDSQCLLINHQKPSSSGREAVNPSSTFDQIPVIRTSLDEDPDSVREHFNRFLAGLLATMSDNRDQEELSIMNSR